MLRRTRQGIQTVPFALFYALCVKGEGGAAKIPAPNVSLLHELALIGNIYLLRNKSFDFVFAIHFRQSGHFGNKPFSLFGL